MANIENNPYRKTSAEELTAMADGLRTIGPFEEDEKFVFPNAAYPEEIPTKLMPKFGSTTVIERDGICESWVRLPEEKWPYGVTSFSKPNYNSYRNNTSEEPEVLTYYIYGLKQFLKQGQETDNGETVIYNDLDDYIEVLNGYYTFTPAFRIQIGTGSIIEVYNENDQLIEKFIIVIYGDLDGSGTITSSDKNIMLNETAIRTWSGSVNHVNYMCKAADLDQNGSINNYDYQIFINITKNEQKVNQISGYAENEISQYSSYTTDTIGQLGFAEAYEEAANCLYRKIASGTLTQEDVNDVVFPYHSYLFRARSGAPKGFLDIKKIKIKARLLTEDYAFNRLQNLEEIEVVDPENITSISGNSICYKLQKLKNIPQENLITSIGLSSFAYCTSIQHLNSDNLTFLGYGSLRGCTNLTTVNAPKLKSTYSYSFSGCTNLTDVSVPALETLGLGLFNNCNSLIELSLPSAKSIGTGAFMNCNNLERLYLPATPPDLLGVKAFWKTNGSGSFVEYLPNLTIYIPNGSLSEYQKPGTNWEIITQNITFTEI